MKLHRNNDDFNTLASLTANELGIPVIAVKKDYFIVSMLEKLEKSPYSANCVFKGGTSLSKCYPGSIERFSEDIDLTFTTDKDMSKKQYSKVLKHIETIMSEGYRSEIIPEERNDRNKSSFVFFDDNLKVKLEIGSSVRPDPFHLKTLKSYIHEYLEKHNYFEEILEYDLHSISINALAIERTFLDKVMAVKRHALCGTLDRKVRHIYDVVKLFRMDEITEFLNNADIMRNLLVLTKETDSYYLEKRNVPEEYNPLGAYDFASWSHCFDDKIRTRYERLHEDLLYTDIRQDFDEAIQTFSMIDVIFANIGE